MRKLTKEINVGMPINKALFHSDSSLLAVMPDDFTIKIYDLDSQKLVRNLEGHDSPITCAVRIFPRNSSVWVFEMMFIKTFVLPICL